MTEPSYSQSLVFYLLPMFVHTHSIKIMKDAEAQNGKIEAMPGMEGKTLATEV